MLGGSGFVGRLLSAALAGAGREVVSVGRRPVAPRGAVRYRSADLCSAGLDDLLRAVRPAVVVNAAGAVWHPTERELRCANVVLVRRVLARLPATVGVVRFVQLGSSKEYAPRPPGTATGEDAPARPGGAYGASKLRATEAVLDATRRGTVAGTVLRLPTVLGPDSPPASLVGRVCAELAAAARERRPAVLRLSALSARQDFLDATDLAGAVRTVVDRDPAVGRIVNLGYGAAIPVRSVVDLLVAASGVPATVVEREDPGRPDRLDWQCLDVSAAAGLLGWVPRRPLRDSLAGVWAAADPRGARAGPGRSTG